MLYADRDVLLVDKDERIVALWDFAIRATRADIMRIPCVQAVADLPASTPEGARLLVGWWLDNGTGHPVTKMCKRGRLGTAWDGTLWGKKCREHVAFTVARVKHWRVQLGSYEDLPLDQPDTTWFVDPPYQRAGKTYRHGPKDIDYQHLAEWCRALPGQAIVCEAADATWLPFEPFGTVRACHRVAVSHEGLWTNS